MNKKLSSLKIHNIVVCAIILIVFVIFGVANARAEEINNNDEVLPSNNIQLGKNYRKLIEENNKKQTTNNEMELMGILTAMELYGDYHTFPDGSVPIVYTDSAYCYNTLTNWMYSWANNGWTRGPKHEPVKNLEIIKRFYELITDKGYKIDLQKVKGHNNIKR